MLNINKLIIKFLIMIISFAVLISCGDSEGNDNVNENKNESQTYVKTIKLSLKSFTKNIYILGVAKPYHQANISSDEGGKIKDYLKRKGSFVMEGEVIAVLDNDVLKASMDAAKAQYDMAENNYVRQEQIYKEKVTSELQFLNAKYERDAALANYELVKARYEKTFIKAPFNGIFDRKFVEKGEQSSPGMPIVSLISMHQIKIEAGIPENFVNVVKKGDKTRIVFKDLDNAEYNAKVTFVGNSILPDNRTFPIEILINNKDLKIKPELSAQVYIEKTDYENVFIIPEETVEGTDVGHTVFVEEDGIAKMKIVKLLHRSENEIVVSEGLNDGDNLIIVGYQNLIDGERIKVLN